MQNISDQLIAIINLFNNGEKQNALKKASLLLTHNEKHIDLLIGPEGGLTDSETKFAYKKGFIGVSLGSRTLRSETAAISAIAIIQSQWGDMKADFTQKKR